MADSVLGPKDWLEKWLAGCRRTDAWGSFLRAGQARVLSLEALEARRVFASLPFGAMEQDTAEFMLGRVAVTPVFLESNGLQDTSTENWTPSLIEQSLANVRAATDWWVELLAAQRSVHSLEFVIDPTYANAPVPTRYEPISRVSDDFSLWTEEFLNTVGSNRLGTIEANMRAFNNSQRQKLGTDWAFTIFVINSHADADGQFANGGAFQRAFAFAGGLFLVSPATRPVSTFSHEIGHMFWARDEYAGGASFTERRGYYNTQNLNAADNSTAGFVQQPSIMATGALLDAAFANRISSASTLAMIGWQDSDGDGIFDVLDVPLELAGTGYYDSATATYRFKGSAKVGTLPNLNSEGLRNDITLNKVMEIQYRVGSGPWIRAASPNQYQAELDLSIPIASSDQPLEIRAIDTRIGLSSNIFQGSFARSQAVAQPGVNGSVWIDADRDGVRDVQEAGEAGWTVELLSAAGQALNLRRQVEPDALPDGVLTASSISGVNISTVGSDTDGRAAVFTDTSASTGTKTFRAWSRSSQSWSASWSTTTRRLRVDLAAPTSVVQIDAIGISADSYARLEAYDSSGNLIARSTSSKLAAGQSGTLRVEARAGNIAFVLVGGHANATVRLDNLRYGPETTATTTARGQYALPLVPAGNYLVRVTPAGRYQPLSLGGHQLATSLTTGGTTTDVDFGFVLSGSSWQNLQNRFDVNGLGDVTPLDVLLIINEINLNGVRDLGTVNFQPPPYIDVNGDGSLTALDALLVINFINTGSAGEGEAVADLYDLEWLAQERAKRKG